MDRRVKRCYLTKNTNYVKLRNKSQSLKIAVCAIGKWEEQYLVEWVEHYKRLCFDNILFYDNNDEGNDGQYGVLKPYINEGFVIYHDIRGEKGESIQKNSYKHCMNTYKKKYDWIAFFDCDEFLELVEYTNIKNFINSNVAFDNFQGVSFNFMLVGDNDLVYNNPLPLNKRFYQSKLEKNKSIKTIVNTHKCVGKIKSVHVPFCDTESTCNYEGNVVHNPKNHISSNPIYEMAFIKHYRDKTIEETIKRIKRGDCNPRGKLHINNAQLNDKIAFYVGQFFKHNKITHEKLNVITREFPTFTESVKYKKLLNSICSGCSACEKSCPTNAIMLNIDVLTGFKFAEIDTDKCINCGKCDKVCPHNTANTHNLLEQKKYAFKSLDENILKKSSSGGAFTHITKPLLEQGWKVVGVRWDKKWHAEYAIVDTVEEWEKLCKSKYMQGDIGDLFPKIKNMLDNGDKIVFTGVPCHVSGLLNYLGKEYNNLLTIDLLCGALHSPKVWDKWYEYEGLDKSTFTSIDMRYKCDNGKGNHTIHIEKNNGQIHDIMMATTPIWNLTYGGRELSMDACHNCKYRTLNRVSDITISDMHNVKDIAPDFLDKRNDNVSSILCNTLKGMGIINSLSLNDIQIREIEGVVSMPQNFKRRNIEEPFNTINENGITFPKIKEETPYDIAVCGGTFNANFGATLTYYALYRYLELIGYNVVILPPFDKKFKGGMLEDNVFEKHCNIAPNYFKSNQVDFNKLANTFVMGSDQMWNPKCALYTSLGLKVFLNYVKNNKNKIAYSVSTGGLLFPGTLEGDDKYDEIKRLLSKFDAISCREEEGCNLIKEHCNINVEQTIDPVFLLSIEEYNKLINESKVELPNGEYGCYYATSPNEKELNFFHKLNEKLGIENVVIGCGQPNSFKNYSAKLPNENFVNPINAQDWLKYIKNAKYVITSSFHCVCFCIIFNIPFICLRNTKNIRLKGVLEPTNLKGNCLDTLDIDKSIEIVNKPINHLHYLNNFIEYSKKWIDENIL